MKIDNLTIEQSEWLNSQIAPMPTVFILAYARTGGMLLGWKFVRMMSQKEFTEIADVKKYVVDRCPSVLRYAVLKVRN